MSATQATPGRAGPRSIALAGPYAGGKTSLFEAMLAAAGSGNRRAAPRAHVAGTEVRLAHCTYLGDPWSVLDCPGSVEFAFETEAALAVVDMAVVVCEPSPDKAASLAPLLRSLGDRGVPHLMFVNKMDTLSGPLSETLAALQAVSLRPLVLRQVPLREGEHVTGYADLISERAYRYQKGKPSELIALPAEAREPEQQARGGLMETLADHDDALLTKLLEDVVPERDEIYCQLHKDQASGSIVEVLLGMADRDGGVRRLWKALRHDAPGAAETAARVGVKRDAATLAQVFRTVHAPHTGKLSYARIWSGAVRDGATLNGSRVSGVFRVPAGELAKVAEANAGDIVALGKLDGAATGDTLTMSGPAQALDFPAPPPPVFALAVATADRKDDVKLSGALAKLADEDRALVIAHDRDTGETVLQGQGEVHLAAAVERLGAAHNVKVTARAPRIAFKETIRQKVRQHARLKRQTGGHGQFADVTLEVEPLPRGEGFRFTDRIVGGAVPRQYIPAVGDAAREAMRRGPRGYPVVDVGVTLLDGGYHDVDSSDMAFRTATLSGVAEALATGDPVLLEPVDRVTVFVPEECTAGAQRLLTGHRGQILGYAARDGWPGWDQVHALVPASELSRFIIELRSQTMGQGSFVRHFEHLAEAPPRLVELLAAAGA